MKLSLAIAISSLFVIGSLSSVEAKSRYRDDKHNIEHKHKDFDSKPKISANNNEIELTTEGVKAKYFIIDLAKSRENLSSIKSDSVFACDMHPFEISDKADSCKICNMKLVKIKKSELKIPKQSHHIEAVFTKAKDDSFISDLKAKLKVISSDKSSQEKMMQDNMGYFGTDLNLKSGNNGLITLIRYGNNSRVFKFNYDNGK